MNCGRGETSGKLVVMRLVRFVLLLLAITFLFRDLRADTTAVALGSFTPERKQGTQTFGWRFTVNTPIQVTKLGILDADRNGLSDSHLVGIWDEASKALLVSGTVPAGTAGLLDGDFRFVDVTPKRLAPGSYVIGAYYVDSVRDWNVRDAGSMTVQPQITHTGSCYSSPVPTGFVFPNVQENLPRAHFGPNFQFIPASEIAATLFDFDPALNAFQFGYEVTGSKLTQPLSISFYWTFGPSPNPPRTLAYSSVLNAPADLSLGEHAFNVPTTALNPRAPGVTHLILEVNSNHSIAESTADDNWKALLLKPRTPAELALMAVGVPYASVPPAWNERKGWYQRGILREGATPPGPPWRLDCPSVFCF